jgi:uridine kinase
MTRNKVLQDTASVILSIKHNKPIRVAIDGIDCAGKTIFANDLVEFIKDSGRAVIRASLDDFHNPRDFRYQRGRNSPEGYYFDSFNYKALFQYLLNPLGSNGDRKYKSKVFDYVNDEWVKSEPLIASNDSILLFDGIFLLRPELEEIWDLSVYLEISYDESIKRAIERQEEGSYEISELYQSRYIPGQKLYHIHVGPKRKADIIVDNNDLEKPLIIKVNPDIMLKVV